MKLTDSDKEYLKKCGCLEEDFEQIEIAIEETVYPQHNKQCLFLSHN